LIIRAFPAWLAKHPWRVWAGAGIVLLLGSVWALSYAAPLLPPSEMQPSTVDAGEVWEGHAVVVEPGTYHLELRVADGVRVWFDDRLLVDQSSLNLTRGLHPLRIEYLNATRDQEFHLSWAPPSSREDFVDIPVVPARQPPFTFDAVAKARAYPTLVAMTWTLWTASGVTMILLAGLTRLATSVWPMLRSGPMLLFALVAIAMLAWGAHIGVAPWRNWAPDEVRPAEVLYAARQGFSGGWSALYPPVHFYLLNVVIAPFSILGQSGWLALDDPETVATIHVASRGMSVVMGFLTLLLTAVLGEMLVGPRRGVIAAAFALSVPVIVFYSKTTNVDMPYVVWVVAAMVLLVMALGSASLRNLATIGALVALAVATKDQAYGFFGGAAALLLWRVFADKPPDQPWTGRALSTVVDARLWIGLLTCGVVYLLLLGVLWNWEGVADHFRMIVEGPGPFRMFPRTLPGTIDMLLTTLTVLAATLGPVTLVFTAAGLAVAFANPSRYRELLVLLALPASYIVTFVAIVGYVYDRFLVGFAPVMALFAALGLDAAVGLVRHPRLRKAMTAIVLALALLPSIALNWRIVSDSRLQAEQWMVANLRDDPFILGVGTRTYLPNLYPYRHALVVDASPADLRERQPDVVILNEQWRTRAGVLDRHDVPQMLRDAGYQEVFAAGGPLGEPGWMKLARFGTKMHPAFSNLEKIDPPLQVWRKVTR
jgi:hypothetical protein